MVARKIDHHRFVIGTRKHGVEVSWQVPGIRHDAYAYAHRIPVEEDEQLAERGHYLHPVLFGAPKELGIGMESVAGTAQRSLRSSQNSLLTH